MPWKNCSSVCTDGAAAMVGKFFLFFYLYIYPPNSQESDGGAIHR